MSLGYMLQSGLEILAVAGVVVALIFEQRIARWEKRMIKRIKGRFTKRSNVIPFKRVS